MHILLVEDSPSDVRLLKELMADEGFDPSIHWVMKGDEALDYVFQRNNYKQAARPDLILLDLGLPRISGYDVLKTLKEDTVSANIPVFILTTSHHISDQEQCKALGADGFFSKPHVLKEYEALVNKLAHEIFPNILHPSKSRYKHPWYAVL